MGICQSMHLTSTDSVRVTMKLVCLQPDHSPNILLSFLKKYQEFKARQEYTIILSEHIEVRQIQVKTQTKAHCKLQKTDTNNY